MHHLHYLSQLILLTFQACNNLHPLHIFPFFLPFCSVHILAPFCRNTSLPFFLPLSIPCSFPLLRASLPHSFPLFFPTLPFSLSTPFLGFLAPSLDLFFSPSNHRIQHLSATCDLSHLLVLWYLSIIGFTLGNGLGVTSCRVYSQGNVVTSCAFSLKLKASQAPARTTSGHQLNGLGMLLLSQMVYFSGFIQGLKVTLIQLISWVVCHLWWLANGFAFFGLSS